MSQACQKTFNSVRMDRMSSSLRLLVNDAPEIVALNVVSAYLEALRSKATRDTLAEQQKLAADWTGGPPLRLAQRGGPRGHRHALEWAAVLWVGAGKANGHGR